MSNSLNSGSSYSSWQQVPARTGDYFSWWSAEESVYHATTRLNDGRHGLLVDPGAWSNLVGEQWITDMTHKALDAGLQPEQQRMDKPLTVQGVGSGSNRAEWEIRMPIAVTETTSGEPQTRVFDYKAPTVTGPGKHLPALLGLQSMSRQNGVLEMKEGEEFLTFPGPGGYSIEWSPGTRRYKLERAPSGHLILPCDSYEHLTQSKGGLTPPTREFFTNDANAKQEGQSAASTDANTPTPVPTPSPDVSGKAKGKNKGKAKAYHAKPTQ